MKRILMIAVLMALGGTAYAQKPGPKPQHYGGSLGATWGIRQIFTADDTTEPIQYDGSDDDDNPACFAWGSMVVIRAADGEFSCVWSMSSTITVGVIDSGQECTVTSTGTSRSGPTGCFQISDTEKVDQTPTAVFVTKLPNARTRGICTGSVRAPAAAGSVYLGCRAHADCTEAGATGTCDLSLSAADKTRLMQKGCAMLLCQTDTDGAMLLVSVEQ